MKMLKQLIISCPVINKVATEETVLRPTPGFVFGLFLGFAYAFLSSSLVTDMNQGSREVKYVCTCTFDSNSPARDVFNQTHVGQLHAKQRSLSDQFGSTIDRDKTFRILCWIMTSPRNLQTRAKFIQQTWAKRCDKHLFISSETNERFPTVGVGTSEGRPHLTEKTMLGYKYVYDKHFHDADWFLKTDDDAYVIVENLRYFLSSQNPEEPVFFGHHFKTIVRQGYFSGGPGIVLSKEALRRFGRYGNQTNRCRNQHGDAGDAKLGKCMQNVGVKIRDSRDRYRKSLFHCFDPETHLRGNYPAWYYDYDADGAKSGPESMSTYSIAFHYSINNILTLHQFLYHVQVHGLEKKNPENVNKDMMT